MPQHLLRDQGLQRAGDVCLDGFSSGGRVGGCANGSADNQVVCAVPDGLERGHHALLVIIILYGPDTGAYRDQAGIGMFTQGADFQTG